jgi:hypothetical protein
LSSNAEFLAGGANTPADHLGAKAARRKTSPVNRSAAAGDPARQCGFTDLAGGEATSAIKSISGSPKPQNARGVIAALRTTLDDWLQFSSASDRTELLTLLAQARNANKDEIIQDDLLAVSTALAAMK